jgi:hypothetical protein
MKLVGCTDIDDALRRLDKVTQKEALIVAAQALDTAHRFHDEVIHVAGEVDSRVKDIDSRMKCLEGQMNPSWEIIDSAQPCVFINAIITFGAEAIDQMAKDPTNIDRTRSSRNPFMLSLSSIIRTGKKLRRALRGWISPPDPSVNYNTALEALHEGTTTWFTQSHIFTDWKQSGSLLWIYGNRMLSRALPACDCQRTSFFS